MFQSFLLILKYFPQLVKIAVELEKQIEEGVLEFQIKKDNKKIDVIFKTKGNDAQRASDLNDVFRH